MSHPAMEASLKVFLTSLLGSLLLVGCGSGTDATPSATKDASTVSPPVANPKAGASQGNATFTVSPDQAAAHLGSKGK